MTSERIATVVESIEALRRHDDRFDVFAWEHHGGRLAPALTPEELQRIESALDIRVPDEYRTFLLGVGNGGMGPGYGLQRLALVASEADIPTAARYATEREVFETTHGRIELPIPLDQDGNTVDRITLDYWSGARRLLDDQTPPKRPFPLDAPYLGDASAEPETPNEDIWLDDGTLLLADYGCAIEARLVLDGARRGEVWMRDGSAGAYVPFGAMAGIHSVDGASDEVIDGPVDFLAWYGHWLERCLSA